MFHWSFQVSPMFHVIGLWIISNSLRWSQHKWQHAKCQRESSYALPVFTLGLPQILVDIPLSKSVRAKTGPVSFVPRDDVCCVPLCPWDCPSETPTDWMIDWLIDCGVALSAGHHEMPPVAQSSFLERFPESMTRPPHNIIPPTTDKTHEEVSLVSILNLCVCVCRESK